MYNQDFQRVTSQTLALHCISRCPPHFLTGGCLSRIVFWQEVANAARQRAVGMLEASTFMEVEAPPEAAAALSAEDATAQAEQQYAAELQKELTGGADAEDMAADEQPEASQQTDKVCVLTCTTIAWSNMTP